MDVKLVTTENTAAEPQSEFIVIKHPERVAGDKGAKWSNRPIHNTDEETMAHALKIASSPKNRGNPTRILITKVVHDITITVND